MKRAAKYIITGVIALCLAQVAMAQEQKQKPAANTDFLIINQNNGRHEAVLYPNPTKGNTVKIKSSLLIKSIEIMTMVGKCVLNEKNPHMIYDDVTLTLKDCNPGTYYAKITFEDNQSVIKKLIVRR